MVPCGDGTMEPWNHGTKFRLDDDVGTMVPWYQGYHGTMVPWYSWYHGTVGTMIFPTFFHDFFDMFPSSFQHVSNHFPIKENKNTL